jgi:hypothetical protein
MKTLIKDLKDYCFARIHQLNYINENIHKEINQYQYPEKSFAFALANFAIAINNLKISILKTIRGEAE